MNSDTVVLMNTYILHLIEKIKIYLNEVTDFNLGTHQLKCMEYFHVLKRKWNWSKGETLALENEKEN